MEKPVKSDRRVFRYVAKPRLFVAMKGSGGILRDVSHDGLALDVVGPSLTTKRVHLNFDISETGEHFESLGEIIWKNESGSRIGVRFVDLSDASRRTVRNWLSTKSDSRLSFKTSDLQGREKATNFETPLWMRPRGAGPDPSIVLQPTEITESLIPALNTRCSESASRPALATSHAGVVPPNLEISEPLRSEIFATSAVLEPLKKLQPSADILTLETEIERPSTPPDAAIVTPNFESGTCQQPLAQISASRVLESPEKRAPSPLFAGDMSTSKEKFKSISSPADADILVPTVESGVRLSPLTYNSATSAVLESEEKVASSALSAENTSLLETEFDPVSSQNDVGVTTPNFETRSWLRPRIPVSTAAAAPKPVEKPQPAGTVDSYGQEATSELERPNEVRPNDEDRVYTDVRTAFKKVLTAKPDAQPQLDSMRAARAWQYVFRWMLVGSFVCFGIVAVALGIRLSKDELTTGTSYQTARAFLLDMFSSSNPVPLVMHNNSPASVSKHPLHLDKELKTSRVRASSPSPANKPMANNKYEVLDAKTGLRYFPHTGTSVAVKFEREPASAMDNTVLSRPRIPASVFSESQADANGLEIGRVSHKSSGELPVKEVIPKYPSLALLRNVQGRVALSAIIATDGSLRDIRIIGSPSILDNAALSAVREWRYEAHHENGRPVEVETQIVVEFSISVER